MPADVNNYNDGGHIYEIGWKLLLFVRFVEPGIKSLWQRWVLLPGLTGLFLVQLRVPFGKPNSIVILVP